MALRSWRKQHEGRTSTAKIAEGRSTQTEKGVGVEAGVRETDHGPNRNGNVM